ncbi:MULTISPECIES: DUF4176 domain-containing protein [Listeria]|uniref:DUF4176 domain-containing protein n=1 Tax=Listeria TaxID=1637 RepID=UPI001FC8F960|nr:MULTISPECIES: DUF4176 domain-containing protein [Listeria]
MTFIKGMDEQLNSTPDISKTYLPLGSVVLLKNGQKELMIYGRKQRDTKTNEIYDYSGCLHPEGYIGKEYTIVFNHKSIEKVIFEGYKNDNDKKWIEIMNKDTNNS